MIAQSPAPEQTAEQRYRSLARRVAAITDTVCTTHGLDAEARRDISALVAYAVAEYAAHLDVVRATLVGQLADALTEQRR